MDLAVNGTDVGGRELVSGWSDDAFSVPPRLLPEGFNEFRLAWSETSFQIDLQHRGRNTVTAVRSLTLSPES